MNKKQERELIKNLISVGEYLLEKIKDKDAYTDEADAFLKEAKALSNSLDKSTEPIKIGEKVKIVGTMYEKNILGCDAVVLCSGTNSICREVLILEGKYKKQRFLIQESLLCRNEEYNG